MSKLRPTLDDAKPGTPCMKKGTALLMILNAVEQRKGLISGQLEARGEYCAIGSYFHVNHGTCLPSSLIDEVAAVNDSMPTLTQIQRKKAHGAVAQAEVGRLGHEAVPPQAR